MFEKPAHKSHADKTDDKANASSSIGTNSADEGYTRGRGESATIGPSIRIKGELSGEEDLIIEGSVEGTVQLDNNNLTIGNNGRVSADIRANTVTILGELRGDVVGNEKVVIRKSGNVRGNIVAPRVMLEEGAMFKGSIEMEPNKAGAAAKAAAATTPGKPSKPSEEAPQGVEAGA